MNENETVKGDVERALRAVAGMHNLSVEVSVSQAGRRVEITMLSTTKPVASAEVMTPEGRRFVSMASGYGLKPEMLGRTFVSRGKTLKVVGLTPSRPKNPIDLRDVNSGQVWRCPATLVSRNIFV